MNRVIETGTVTDMHNQGTGQSIREMSPEYLQGDLGTTEIDDSAAENAWPTPIRAVGIEPQDNAGYSLDR